MRVTDLERKEIVRQGKRCFGPKVRITLFGSRTDDRRRGGDIDLLVEGAAERQNTLRLKVAFLAAVKSTLGDQHIDVVIAQPGDRRAIVAEATRTGVML